MARLPVEQVQCDRCKRVELRAPEPKKEKPDFALDFLGQKIIYQDLDQPCRNALARILEDIKEWDRELKQKLGPTVSSNEAAPTQVAPNYTPPKPHSIAAGKR